MIRKNTPVPSKANAFTIVSDQYKKENFHTDILKYLLEFKTEDSVRPLLYIFLDLLAHCKPGCIFKHREQIQVHKEKGGIDIALVERSAMQVIIIENKINGAVDQYKQLLRYFNYYHDRGYEVLGILYLSLDGGKRPDFSFGWTKEDISAVTDRIIYLAAYHENGVDLFKNWLLPSMAIIEDIDLLSVTRQYAHLLQILNKNAMDYRTHEEFYDMVIQNHQHYQTAVAIGKMLNEFPRYIAERLVSDYQFASSVFPIIWVYPEKKFMAAVFQDLMLSEEFNLTIDIEVRQDLLEVTIFEREGRLSPGNDPIAGLLADFEDNLSFRYDASINRYVRQFPFPERKADLDATILSLVNKLESFSHTQFPISGITL